MLVVRSRAHSLEDPIHQGLACGRTSWDVDIYWHNAIAASGDTVAIMVIATSIRTRAHADHPSGIGHLVVNLSQSGSHLVREGASDNHDIGLPRRCTKDYAEAILIVPRG